MKKNQKRHGFVPGSSVSCVESLHKKTETLINLHWAATDEDTTQGEKAHISLVKTHLFMVQNLDQYPLEVCICIALLLQNKKNLATS